MNQQFAKVETQLETLLSAVLPIVSSRACGTRRAMIAPATTASSQARDWVRAHNAAMPESTGQTVLGMVRNRRESSNWYGSLSSRVGRRAQHQRAGYRDDGVTHDRRMESRSFRRGQRSRAGKCSIGRLGVPAFDADRRVANQRSGLDLPRFRGDRQVSERHAPVADEAAGPDQHHRKQYPVQLEPVGGRLAGWWLRSQGLSAWISRPV